MPWMPGVSRVQTFSGNRHKAKVDKLVVHTTEGSGWPGYNNGGNAPHFTFRPGGSIRQHISTDYSAKALVNKSGGVETNNDGVLQVESIGSCDPAWARKHKLFFWPDATDEDLKPLAEILAWAHKEHGVPLTTRGLRFVDTNIAYATAPERMTFAEWRKFTGVCGHQHVPENNHWDPGKMPVQRAIDLAKGLLGEKPSAPTAPGNAGLAEVDQSQRWLAKLGYDPGPVDGVFGTKTSTATREFQEQFGITPADGRPGPATRTHLEEAVTTIADLNKKTDRLLALVEDLPSKVWNVAVALKGGKFEGVRTKPVTTLSWFNHERERVRSEAESARKAAVAAQASADEALAVAQQLLVLVEQLTADATPREQD